MIYGNVVLDGVAVAVERHEDGSRTMLLQADNPVQGKEPLRIFVPMIADAAAKVAEMLGPDGPKIVIAGARDDLLKPRS